MSSTKSNRAASPSPASAIRITSSRRNSPSRRFIGSARKQNMGGGPPPLRRLNLDVVVAGASGVERRQDRAQAVAAVGVGKQMPAIAKADVVIVAALVGMPEVEESARDRLAGARENLPAELDRPCCAVRL